MSTPEVARSLRRLDGRPIDPAPDAVLGCTVVRNEVGRIIPWLDHHRALGVERFLVVDHGSTDGTTEALLAEPDVHVWTSSLDFRAARCGAAFFEVILSRYGGGRWTVIADADELVVHPDAEDRPLADLCRELDAGGSRALGAVLLDLYADTPLASTWLPADRSPLEVAHWFDRRWRHHEVASSGPDANQVGVFGGVRRRLFGGSAWDYCLSKVPLLRVDTATRLVDGQHWTDLPLATIRGAVLHFKLCARLGDFAWDELARGQRPPDDEYHRYADALALDPDLTAWSSEESVRYAGTGHLAALGIVGPVPDPDFLAARAGALTAHAVARVGAGDDDRAVALLDRAVATDSTAVVPLLHLAELQRRRGDRSAAAGSLAEACDRRPEDLDLLARTLDGPPLPPDFDAARLADALPGAPPGTAFLASVDATFGPGGEPVEGAWVGIVHGVVSAPDHLPPFAEFALEALVRRPAFRAALTECRGLVTFTHSAARFLEDSTGVPVEVVAPPVVAHPTAFDPERFAAAPTLVQPGWWMTRLSTVCDLPDRLPTGATLRKVRCVEPPFRRVAVGLARAQRRHDGWAADPAPLRATDDRGAITPRERDALLVDAVVLADLLDANADPVVLRCLGRGLPVAVPPLPGVVEVLGPGYPLHFSRPAEIGDLLADLGRVRAAHEHLLDRRRHLATTPDITAVAAAWGGRP
ncbi:MAG: glycosyltransferase family 2 protein [Actinomycetes bacterium]